jgi:galactokinase/mevalonate kinase-like predicted kinase
MVRYWELKVEMAAGSEPPHIKELLAYLRPLSVGLSLCGAGAGGFAVVILKEEASFEQLMDHCEKYCTGEERLTVHHVKFDAQGIHSCILQNTDSSFYSVDSLVRLMV